MKHNVYLSQVNHAFGKNVFLPYSIGLLQAYAQTISEIKSAFEFKELQYLRESPAEVVKRLDNPAVFGFSCYIWNWEYNKRVAQLVKLAFPRCLVVMGGPQVPTSSDGFFIEHPYADVLVHYEGEHAFAELLLEYLGDSDYTKIPGLSVKDYGIAIKTAKRERLADLSVLPSPYLSGVFDDMPFMQHEFHASQETSRGCPYSCTFLRLGFISISKASII